MDSWILTPGQNLTENLIKTLSFLTKVANHEVLTFNCHVPGEGGPETHFFLQALHKLARALQIKSSWVVRWIERDSFNITYATS